MVTISPTYLFIWNKLTFVGLCVAFWSIFARKNSPRLPMQITWPWPPVGRFSHGLITVRQRKCKHKVVRLVRGWLFTQYMPMSPHGIRYKQTWYLPDVRYCWETCTKWFLCNIINDGESDVQWKISIR